MYRLRRIEDTINLVGAKNSEAAHLQEACEAVYTIPDVPPTGVTNGKFPAEYSDKVAEDNRRQFLRLPVANYAVLLRQANSVPRRQEHGAVLKSFPVFSFVSIRRIVR